MNNATKLRDEKRRRSGERVSSAADDYESLYQTVRQHRFPKRSRRSRGTPRGVDFLKPRPTARLPDVRPRHFFVEVNAPAGFGRYLQFAAGVVERAPG